MVHRHTLIILWNSMPDNKPMLYLFRLTTATVYKYEKHFPKMYKDVGMAVPKTTQTRYVDGSVQRTTQVTPSLHLFFIFVFHTKMFPVISQQSLDTCSIQRM